MTLPDCRLLYVPPLSPLAPACRAMPILSPLLLFSFFPSAAFAASIIIARFVSSSMFPRALSRFRKLANVLVSSDHSAGPVKSTSADSQIFLKHRRNSRVASKQVQTLGAQVVQPQTLRVPCIHRALLVALIKQPPDNVQLST